MSDERHDAVSRRAYELWQREGGEHGRHEDHWHRATRELTEESVDVPVNVTAPDGTTMPVATAVEEVGEEQQAPAKTPRKRAAAKPAVETDPVPPPASGVKPSAKPRKPKAK
jgi:hypothetical protein